MRAIRINSKHSVKKNVRNDKRKVKENVLELLKNENGFNDKIKLQPHKQDYIKKTPKQIEKDEKTRLLKKKGRRYSIYDGVGFNIMEGSGHYFISPFIIRLGATTLQIGLLSSLSSLLSAFSQLISTEVVDKIKNRKKIILYSVIIQALIWIPLMLNALIWKNVNLTIFLFAIFSISGSFIDAPYASWLGDLIDKNAGHFFGRRNKILKATNFITILLSGFLLNRFVGVNTLVGFAVLFLIALIARLFSLFFVRKMHEPEYKVGREHYFSFLRFIKRMKYSNFGTFVLYLFFIWVGIAISSPYFTPYLLKDLKFSYGLFVIIDVTMVITAFLTFESWGKLSDKIGNKAILAITGYSISFYPILWLFSRNPFYLIGVNAVMGVAWAGFALSSSNYIYDAVTPAKRARCVAYSNFFKGIAIFIGAMLGAFIGTKINLSSLLPGVFLSKYHLIFLVSGLLRLIISIYFIKRIKEVKIIGEKSTVFLFKTITSSIGEGMLPFGAVNNIRRIKNNMKRKTK